MNARECRDAAEKARGGGELGFFTDASKDPVLVAIDTPSKCYVVAIDRAEYDGFKLARVLKVPVNGPMPAAEMARRKQQEGKKK